MENKLLDYHEFYGESGLYIPARVSYEWIDENEDFMRETLFSFYETYSRLKINELLIPLLKLYSDIILAAYINFEEKGHYF